MGLSPRGLRILAYHDVPDAETLRQQLDWVGNHFDIVNLDQVIELLQGRSEIDRPALVTFDDGDPSVIERGRPVLESLGIGAVLFVCPGIVDSNEPFWWQTVNRAIELGVELGGRTIGPPDLRLMKTMPDPDRRNMTRRLGMLVGEMEGTAMKTRQVTTEELRGWVDAGNALGNHTWDHPTLDTCSRDEQIAQIERAHSWLVERSLMPTPLFAYPNGNETPEAHSALAALGYAGAMLFDHRIDRGADPLAISRLRVNVDDDADTFVSKVSGLHPALHAISRRS